MPARTKRTKKEAKVARWEDLQEALCKYNKILFVEADNVTSKQICVMRRILRNMGAKMIMGKNTHMKAAIAALQAEPKPSEENYEERIATYQARPHLALVKDQLHLNIGMILTNGDLTAVKEVLDTHVREAPAKVGSLAPKAVVVPPGPTGMDPKQTQFFQALNIATKIVKAQIEIVNPVTVIAEGDKIGQSQAALLDRLKIRPFEYKMAIKSFLDNGKIYNAKVLSIKNEDVIECFQAGIGNMTALSLGSGYTIPSAAPHLIIGAFKNLAGAAIAADYSFPLLEGLKAAAAAGPAVGGGGAAAAAAGGDDKKEDAKEEEEEDEDIDMGGMFGDDEY
jgi:large subunit ribosomal protein LP0